jgi:hypothetical protein
MAMITPKSPTRLTTTPKFAFGWLIKMENINIDPMIIQMQYFLMPGESPMAPVGELSANRQVGEKS